MIIPVLARTPEGAKSLLSMIEGYGAAAAELAVPLKRCAMACIDTLDWREGYSVLLVMGLSLVTQASFDFKKNTGMSCHQSMLRRAIL